MIEPKVKIKSYSSIFGGTLEVEMLMKKETVPRVSKSLGDALWNGTEKEILVPSGSVLLKIIQDDHKEAVISVDITELEKVISVLTNCTDPISQSINKK